MTPNQGRTPYASHGRLFVYALYILIALICVFQAAFLLKEAREGKDAA
jgi:hypothetical protein